MERRYVRQVNPGKLWRELKALPFLRHTTVVADAQTWEVRQEPANWDMRVEDGALVLTLPDGLSAAELERVDSIVAAHDPVEPPPPDPEAPRVLMRTLLQSVSPTTVADLTVRGQLEAIRRVLQALVESVALRGTMR